MSPKKRTNAFFRIIIPQLLFCLISSNAIPAPSAAKISLDQLVQDALKVGGQGLLTRIRNMTDYGADIKFEPILHDKLPKNTTARIKRADGMYLTCRKVDSKPTIAFEKCEAADAATLWIIDRIKDESLHDWIGLSHSNSDGFYLSMDTASGHAVFASKELRVENKAAQWEVIGSSIDAFFLRNRLTGGMLHQQTKDEDQAQGEDKEEIISAQDVWYTLPVSSGAVISYGNLFTLIDEQGKSVQFAPGDWQPITRIDGYPGTTKIAAYKAGDGNNRSILLDEVWAHLFNSSGVGGVNKSFVVHGNQSVCSSHHWPHWGPWEFVKLSVQERAKDTYIHWGDKVEIWSIHGTKVSIEGSGYKGFPVDKPASLFYVMPADFNEDMNANQGTAKWNGSRGTIFKGAFEQIALANANDAYGVTHTKKLFHFDGSNWSEVATSFRPRHVSVSSKGDLCCVDINKKLWIKQGSAWAPVDGNWTVAAMRNKNEIWLIGTDGTINKYNGSSTETLNIPNQKAKAISVSEAGNLWAVATDTTIWRYDAPSKKWLNVPGGGKKIAVRSETDVWMVGSDSKLYHYENNTWADKNIQATDIAVSSGVTINKILAPRKKVTVTSIGTSDNDNKPYTGKDSSKLSIGIEKLGMGGALGPKTSFDFSGIPASQRPRVSGFAVDRLDDFDPTAILSVNPLISQGAAWLETSLAKPDQGGVSFMMRVRDAGDAQVIFGPEMSNSFTYKVIFGGWGNTKSAIVKREYVKGDPVDTVVYELTVAQYPTARIPSGIFASYWVSIQDGLIMAGMGDFGANVFMAWRDPNPKTGITRVGFGSHKTPVQYNNIKLTPPAIFSSLPRVFSKSSKSFTTSTGGAVTWSDDSFRTNDRGSLQCGIQGTKSGAVILARKKNTAASHYAIVFGDDNNRAITIKKWHTGQKKYNERARIKLDPLPLLKLDAKRRKTFWVSFYFGQIVIGTGNIGTNPMYLFQDLAPIDGIDSVGFSNLGDGSISFGNLQIGAPLVLHAEQQAKSYDKSSGPKLFSGGLTIILPFDYELSQEDQVVKLTDYVLGQSFYLGATPQQGAIYAFQATINPNGTLTLDWTKAPENQKQLDIQRAVMKVKNEAELDKVEADQIRAQGAIDQILKTAEGDKGRNKASALSQGGQTVASMGASAGSAMAMAGPIGAAIGAVITGVALAAGGAMVGVATDMSMKAADKDYEGAELKAIKERQAANATAAASAKSLQAESSASLATVGLRSNDSYVFVDKPGARPDMGTQNTSETAKKNRADAEAKLAEAAAIRPTAIDPDMIKLSLLYLDMVLLANQSSVLSGDSSFKTRFLNGVDKLLHAYLDTVSKDATVGTPLHQDMLTLLLNAYNNPYLINDFVPDEAKTKNSWYWLVTIFGRQLIGTTDARAINTDKFYGEYIWLDEEAGFGFTTPGTGIVSFEARGEDIFVCLTEEKARVRNSEVDVYEVNIGGWDNTKTAIRVKSLDRYVAVVTKKDNPKAMANPTAFKKYWVACDNGLINVGCGEPGQGTVLSWQDPYPNTKVAAVGLSSWNSRVEYRNIVVAADMPSIEAAQESAVAAIKDSSGLSFDDLMAKLATIITRYKADGDGTQKLTPDATDILETQGVDLCTNGFNNRSNFTFDQLSAFHEALNTFTEDVSDDDNYTLITTMADIMEQEIAEQADAAAKLPVKTAAPEGKKPASKAPTKAVAVT